MLIRSLLVVAALSLHAASASALSFTFDGLPVGPIVSGNGQLEFSNFQFFSPFMTVAPSQVTATILDDGIELSGPISASNGLKNFFVLYEVNALGAGIEEASLLLHSKVDADIFGLVLSTKQILGEVNAEPHDGWHLHKKGNKGFGFDHGFPSDRRTLALLKTADWEFGRDEGCFRKPFGHGSDGAIRLVEAGFDPQQSIRVIDGVTIKAWDGTATWESSTNRYSVVPEPGTASLLLLGLGLIALRAHRRH